MNRLNRYALSLLALSVTLAIIAGVNATPTQASGSAPVTVVNTPLPVTGNATVSGTVNIGNTPTVNAQQSGSWTVDINGTPSVSIANGAVTASVPAITKFRDVFEPSLPGNNSADRDYTLDAPMTVTTVEVCSNDDLYISLHTDGLDGNNTQSGTTDLLFLGWFPGNKLECRVVNLAGPIAITGFRAHNPNILSATFHVIALGH